MTDDRNAGFKEVLEAEAPPATNIELVAEQTANYVRERRARRSPSSSSRTIPTSTSSTPTTTRWRSAPSPRCKAAGYQPGDVKIITIDGTQGAVQGIVDGWISGVIESNPRFGPLAFEALDDFYNGDGVPQVTIIGDKEYTNDNAEAELPNAY